MLTAGALGDRKSDDAAARGRRSPYFDYFGTAFEDLLEGKRVGAEDARAGIAVQSHGVRILRLAQP
jgi:hypothetical protein